MAHLGEHPFLFRFLEIPNQGSGMKFDVALGKKKIAQTFTNSFFSMTNEFVKV